MNGNIIRIPLSWSSIIPKKSFFESFDKFFAIPIVGAIEFAIYGSLVWIIDIFFNFLPSV